MQCRYVGGNSTESPHLESVHQWRFDCVNLRIPSRLHNEKKKDDSTMIGLNVSGMVILKAYLYGTIFA